jgi:hypothetical protein
MNKREVKYLLNELKQGYTQDDENLTIITNNKVLNNNFDDMKCKINDIQIFIFESGYTRMVYLKNGLKSYRKAMKDKLI